MQPLRFLILGSAVSLAHLLLSFAVFAVLFSAGMDRFDHGGAAASWERPAEVALYVLSFPAVAILQWLPLLRQGAILENACFLLNSCLWGFGAAWILLLRHAGT